MPIRQILRRQIAARCAAGIVLAALGSAAAASERRGNSGLPLPRFVSLKSDPVNLRTGPGRTYPKAWVFRRAGLPIEIIQEHENWRRVRDSEGATGWISQFLLSGRRTALVLPWDTKKGAKAGLVDLRTSASHGARPVARLEAGSLANIKSCNGRWCRVAVSNYEGYIEQEKLWGVYPDEVIR